MSPSLALEIPEAVAIRKKLVEELQKEIEVLQRAEEILKSPNGAVAQAKALLTQKVETPLNVKRIGAGRFGPKWKKSIADATEEMLEQTETGRMRLVDIHSRLGDRGMHTTLDSVDSALRKDKKKRFKLTDVREYGLVKKLEEIAKSGEMRE